MKLRCRRDLLHRGVQTVAGVVDPRNVKPILQDISFKAKGGMVELAATDLEVGMRYQVEKVTVEEEGEVVVPAQQLAAILRESPDEELTIETKGNMCGIRGSDAEFDLPVESAEDFPQMPGFPEGNALELDELVIRDMVQKTKFAVAATRTTYALNGALLVIHEGKKEVEMVGADGRRLARVQRKATKPAVESARVILPTKALAQLEKMVGADGEEAVVEGEEKTEGRKSAARRVKIRIDERRFLASAGNCVLVAQLLEGRYPDYEEVIPTDCDKKAEMSRDSLLSAVRRAALMSSRESRSVIFTFSNDRLKLDAEEPGAGKAAVEMALSYKGPDARIIFNADYITDMLRVCAEDSVAFEFKNTSQACLFHCGKDYIYLVMPITRDEE